MGIYGVDFYGTTFYGAPLYLKFDARPFTATPVGYGATRLNWVNPEGDWDRLRVVRSSYGFPSYPDDGTLILEQDNSPRTNVTDTDVKEGKFFYYSIFVREIENFTWIRAGDVIALPVKDHRYGEHLFSLMPGFMQEADLDRATSSQPQGPLERYLRVLGISLDHIRTEYETLRWLRNPERISGNLLHLLANQFGLPHEPALGMRQTRVWVRDAVYLYRHKGTRPGVEAAASAITGWGSRVSYSRNLLRATHAHGWYGNTGTTVSDGTSPDDASIPTMLIETTDVAAMAVSTAPTDKLPGPLEEWFGLRVEPGTDYTVQGEIRPPAIESAGISYRWIIDWYAEDGTHTTVTTIGDVVTAADAQWRKVTLTANSPLDARFAAISLESTESAAAPSEVYLRRTQFERSSIATTWVEARALVVNFDPVRWNFIPNPAFENGQYGWTIVTGTATVDDRPVTESGRSLQLDGEMVSEKLGLATPGVPHSFSFYADTSVVEEVTLSIEWFAAAEDEQPIFSDQRVEVLTEGISRPSLASTAPSEARFARVRVAGTARVGSFLFEEGSVPGEYFDGGFFGADWLWAGIANASASKYYPGRAVRNVRVRELLPHYLPLNQSFVLNYVGGAPTSGQIITGDEGVVGVGTYGIMPFGQ